MRKKVNNPIWGLFFLPVAFALCFSPGNMQAQITFGEKKEPVVEEQEHPTVVPYDSTYLYVKVPAQIEEYKKYIGQQLFLLDFDETKEWGKQILLTRPVESRMILPYYKGSQNSETIVLTDCYKPILEGNGLNWSYYMKCKKEDIVNKYYEIIDVKKGSSLNLEPVKLPIKAKRKVGKILKSAWRDAEPHLNLTYMRHEPYVFVMKETSSGDTVYTGNPERFLIVGGFVKMQKECIGKYYVKRAGSDAETGVKERWKCTNVTVIDNEVKYVLQKEDDAEETVELPWRYDFNGSYSDWISETEFDKRVSELQAEAEEREKKRLLAEQERKREEAEAAKEQARREAKNQAEKEARKQSLIRKYGQEMGLKVFERKPEIGMTEEMIKDMGTGVLCISTDETDGRIEKIYTTWSHYIVLVNGKVVRITSH